MSSSGRRRQRSLAAPPLRPALLRETSQLPPLARPPLTRRALGLPPAGCGLI